ncbi:MAG: DUF4145 domain-containing protein [Thermotogae bacterium]|nr:DUF4145 domain-containing protein [Thermotogota bacterium]
MIFVENSYEKPEFKKDAFNCPYCDAYAHQEWKKVSYYDEVAFYDEVGKTFVYNKEPTPVEDLWIVFCQRCKKYSIWNNETMIFPQNPTVSIATKDTPKDVLDIYNEARKIANYSPRAAAALLRLAIQKLLIHLGQKGENLNEDIGHLVSDHSIDEKIQKSLDIVRVIGNNAVHPGVIDVDNKEITFKLFALVNIIVESTITLPQEINGIYNSLPQDSKESIEKRDNSHNT